MATNVVIYSTPSCAFCKMAKEFFKEHDIEYTEHDVAGDQKMAQEMIDKSGQMGVPVILITQEDGKEEMIIGFDKEKISGLLDIKD